MILYINNEHCSSVEQLKGYFTENLTSDSDIYNDLLDYGRYGDIAVWLREMGEPDMASKVDSISGDLGDSAFFAQLKAAILGTEIKADDSLKPSFDKCFAFECVKCDMKDNEAKISASLKVLLCVNEEYELSVSSNWGTRAVMVNPYNYSEGKTATLDFTLRKRPGKEVGEITIKADGKELSCKKIQTNIDDRLLDDAYRFAKEKLNAIQKNIKENPCHVYDAYDGVGSSDREKEEDIINKEIRPLAERGHKLASIDYYWYLFVRRYDDAEKFAISYEANHKGEKLIETPLTDDQLYEKVQEMFSIISDKRSRSLSRTAWTGEHSTDINKGYDKEKEMVFNKFIIPLIKKGHRKSCLVYYEKLLLKDRERAKLFLNEYRSKHPGDNLVEHETLDQVFGFQTDKMVRDLRESIIKSLLK